MSQDTLKRHLAERGPLSVADYMAWCLTGDERAYYRSGDPIGGTGDFITAPEISQIFGELTGLWMGSVWLAMGQPRPVMLIELGPGRGTLMRDALRALRVVPGFTQAARLHLVERSQTLRALQGQALAHAMPVWHESLETVPDGPAILIANEFFDALAVAQFVYCPDGWRERVVCLDAEGNPAFAAGKLARLPAASMPPLAPQPGAILEARPSALPVLRELGRRAGSSPAAALIVDYGYARDATGDTLQAVRAHAYAPPLDFPGASDLSAHVNFAELSRMAACCGLAAWGPLPQGAFLTALGLEARLHKLMASAGAEQRQGLFLGARRLTDPFQMGSLFKAMALTSVGLRAPPPFAPAQRSDLEAASQTGWNEGGDA